MKKRLKLKRKVKITLLTIMLAFTTYFGITTTYSRYVSEVDSTNKIKVANSGELKVVEKIDGELEENNLDIDNLVEYEITLGENIKKEVYVELLNSEVSNYLFLEVDVLGWSYDNNLKEFSIINNSSKILRFYLNNSWNYLEQFSADNKYIFVMDYDVNEIGNNKIEVVNEVVTNIISENDFDSLNSSQVNFNVKSIQKTDGLSIEDAWNYLNM